MRKTQRDPAMTRSTGDAPPCRSHGEPPAAGLTDEQENLAKRLDQVLFALEAEHYETFVETLFNPPEPGPKLRALLRRRPAWQR